MSLLLRRGIISSGRGGVFDVNSANLNGTTQWFSTPDNAALDITGDITIAIWVFPTSSSSVQGLVSKWGELGNTSFLLLQNGAIPIFALSDDGTAFNQVSLAALTLSTWNLIICKLTGTTMSISVNDGTPVTNTHTGGIFNSSDPTYLGFQDRVAGDRPFEGSLYQPLILDRATTSGEDTALYNLGIPKCYDVISTTITDDVVYAPEIGNIGTGGSELIDRSTSSLTTTNIASTPFTGTGLTSEC